MSYAFNMLRKQSHAPMHASLGYVVNKDDGVSLCTFIFKKSKKGIKLANNKNATRVLIKVVFCLSFNFVPLSRFNLNKPNFFAVFSLALFGTGGYH